MIGDFVVTIHYFVQPQEDMKLIHNILQTYALDITAAGAHSRCEMWSMFFSNISDSMIFSPHNCNLELILKSAKLYSTTILKSCNLKCIKS